MSKENTKPQGEKRAESLSKAVLGMLAVGLGGGIALIAAAKKVGDAFLAEEDSALSEDEMETTRSRFDLAEGRGMGSCATRWTEMKNE